MESRRRDGISPRPRAAPVSSHRHTSRRYAWRLGTRRPGARGMPARRALRDPRAEHLGDPRRHGVDRRPVAAAASRDGAFDDVNVESTVLLGARWGSGRVGTSLHHVTRTFASSPRPLVPAASAQVAG